MEITIYRELMKLFPPTWRHHHLMIVFTVVSIIKCFQQQMRLIGVNRDGTANPRLDASLFQCALRSARLMNAAGEQMPNRSQWWRDRLKHDYALIGACIVAVLLAALTWFLWMAPDLAIYFATGIIRPPPMF